ncbi:MAG: alpha/beta fold hydrolase [Chitinophagaceae bacterium]|nr:alpha/beta fold hydrolase [Chitinophagaceae bacterium]
MNRVLLLFLFVLIYGVGNVAVAQKQATLLLYIDTAGKETPVHTPAEWEIKRKQVLNRMQLAMGALPGRVNLPPVNIRYTDSVNEKGYTRYTIYFTAAENENVSAYLYVPVQKGAVKKRPAMLALHSTGELGKKIADGQGALSNRAYAKELAEKGYVVIAPDYPSFGDQKAYDFKTDRYQSGTMKSIFDNMRCIDLLQSRPDVDPGKIGAIGHSLGGHNAIFTGAFDTRLKVIVSSCGWTLMHDYFNGDTASAQKYGGKLWPWAQERYMPLIRDQYGLDPDKVPFDFDEAIAAIAPRAFFSSAPVHDANFNTEGVKKGIANVAAVYDFLDVPQHLQVRYPDCQHDFPLQVRWQAYDFIDSVFGLAAKRKTGYSYADNPHYFKRMELFAAQKEQKNIVMLGNSLTEGGQWEEILSRTDVTNRGIGSDITEGYIKRINDVFDLKPTICFIEGGVNDLARNIPQETIIRNLATLIDTLRGEGIIPVMHAVTLVANNYRAIDPETFNSSIKNLNIAIKALAKKKKVMLIDLNGTITDGKYLLKQYAIEDGIHYTAATYSLWGKEIIKILQQQQKAGWVLEQPQAAWQPRDSQGEVVFKNKLWILGGWFNSYEAPPRDVWSSSDGRHWDRVTGEAPWIHSDLAMPVVFKKKMWLMGGWYKGRLEGHSASNQVWSSKDGKQWSVATNAAAWSPRVAAALVFFKGKLWLMGGTENYYFGDQKSLKNDVWYTSDGKDWKLATADAGWPPRAYHQAAVLNGKIYLFGGGNYVPGYFALNDVWSSEDGVHWTKVCDAAPWHERIWFSSVVYRNRLWVMAGWSGNPYKNWSDVWYSENGKEWEQYVSLPVWKERHEPSAFVFQDKIWIAGGMTPPLANDVWSLQLPANW